MLVSATEVRQYMSAYEIIDASLEPVLEGLISRVQTSIETYINRPAEKVQVREIRRSDSKGYLYLSVTPVWKVISCGGTTAPTTVEGETPYTIVRDPSLDPDARIIDKVPTSVNNLTVPGGLKVTSPCSNYVVEYIGGLDGTRNDDIKQILLSIIARIWVGQHIDAAGLERGQVAEISRGDTRVMWLSEDEKNSLKRYKRRVIR